MTNHKKKTKQEHHLRMWTLICFWLHLSFWMQTTRWQQEWQQWKYIPWGDQNTSVFSKIIILSQVLEDINKWFCYLYLWHITSWIQMPYPVLKYPIIHYFQHNDSYNKLNIVLLNYMFVSLNMTCFLIYFHNLFIIITCMSSYFFFTFNLCINFMVLSHGIVILLKIRIISLLGKAMYLYLRRQNKNSVRNHLNYSIVQKLFPSSKRELFSRSFLLTCSFCASTSVLHYFAIKHRLMVWYRILNLP